MLPALSKIQFYIVNKPLSIAYQLLEFTLLQKCAMKLPYEMFKIHGAAWGNLVKTFPLHFPLLGG